MFFIDLNLRVKALMQEYKKRNTFGIKGIYIRVETIGL